MRHLPLAVCIALFPAAQAVAQQPAGLRPFVSVTPVYQFDAEVDSGGEFGVAGAVTRLGVLAPLGQSARVGVSLNYDHLDYRFDAPAAFGGAAPWDTRGARGRQLAAVLSRLGDRRRADMPEIDSRDVCRNWY